jgi:hypothetical protein
MVSLHCSTLPPFNKISYSSPPANLTTRIHIFSAPPVRAHPSPSLPPSGHGPPPPWQPARDNRHHHNQRFLRPGALARLRDRRIVARSLRSSACLLLPRSVPAPTPGSEEQGGSGQGRVFLAAVVAGHGGVLGYARAVAGS